MDLDEKQPSELQSITTDATGSENDIIYFTPPQVLASCDNLCCPRHNASTLYSYKECSGSATSTRWFFAEFVSDAAIRLHHAAKRRPDPEVGKAEALVQKAVDEVLRRLKKESAVNSFDDLEIS